MERQPLYPIGIQSFEKMRTEGFWYVDKTMFIEPLARNKACYFLSRPRRFGKSLFLSTLAAFYRGQRELFRGLAADRMDWDWEPRPVLYVDLNTGAYNSPDGLDERLAGMLNDWEREYGLPVSEQSSSFRFGEIIKRAYDVTGHKVVILVDEYDKPLISNLDNPEIAQLYKATLKQFYSNLKTCDRYIEMAFLTGVARFSKVSIFSDLNNLLDLSLTEEFNDICGWTEDEMVQTYTEGIERLADKRNLSFEATVGELRHYYDGYCFSASGSKLYNPYSVLTALRLQNIDPYWFETGTPTFLARRVQQRGIELPRLNEQYASYDELKTLGIESANPIPLLFQTGYLTITGYDDETREYTLSFPNREVEIGFAKYLLPLYLPETTELDGEFRIRLFERDIIDGRPEDFMLRLQALLAGDAYRSHSEKEYQSYLYLIFTLAGANTRMEMHTSNGRTDIEIKTRRYIYIFELKYNRPAAEAMQQIHERDYARRFQTDPRQLFLIGASFVDRAGCRGLDSWIIETPKNSSL